MFGFFFGCDLFKTYFVQMHAYRTYLVYILELFIFPCSL